MEQRTAMLRESEARFRALVETSFDWFWEVDAEGRYTYVSPKVQDVLGYSPEEMLGKTPFHLMLESEARRVGALFGRIASRREPFAALENINLHKSGRQVVLETSGVPVFDAQGQFTGYRGMDRDITDQKFAENRERLRARTFELMASGRPLPEVLESIVRGVEEEKSSGWCSILLVDESGSRLLHGAAPSLPDFFNQAIDGLAIGEGVGSCGSAAHTKERVIVEDVRTHPFWTDFRELAQRAGLRSCWSEPILSGHGKLLGTFAIYHSDPSAPKAEDLHRIKGAAEFAGLAIERKRAEDEIRRLVTAIEQAEEAVMITDARGTIEYVNPSFCRISGYGQDEVLGRNPRMFSSGRHDKAFYQELWATLASGNVWQGRFVNRRKDGTLYDEITTISPVREASGRIVNFIANKLDVTTLNLLEAQLRQSQKMEVVGTLAGGIAHDFNNLLAVILGNSEMALLDIPEGTDTYECIEEMKVAANRGAQLTRQLLAFSRKQVLHPEILDLNRVIDNLRRMLARMIPESIRLDTAADPELGLVKADPGQIEQVVTNLVVNARDAMHGGGTVCLATANRDLEEPLAVGAAVVPRGCYVVLSVRDTGCGIADAIKGRIFEPFFTTKEQGKGTGLGLATVFGIVTQSNGFITVESEPGHGAEFKVFLPRVNGVPRAVERKPAGLDSFPRGTETILLVEDDDALRNHLLKSLNRCGYSVLVAGNGAEGLEMAAAHAGRFDLVLTDMIMPEMGGRMMARRLENAAPGVKVLFMSGYNDHAELEQLIEEGATFLQKPFSLETLARTVRSVLDEQTPLP